MADDGRTLKPATCRGCPLYQDGRGFVPDEMIEGAPVCVMAQNPGEHEESGVRVTGSVGAHVTTEPDQPRPMIGKTGFELTKYLQLAGLVRKETVSIGNALRCRWRRSNDLPTEAGVLREAIEHCQEAHFRPPTSTRLYVALGNTAKWALAGIGAPTHGVEDWRGYLAPFHPPWAAGSVLTADLYHPGLSTTPVLVTLHPADVFRDPTAVLPVRADWTKVPRILRGTWPIPFTLDDILTDPDPTLWGRPGAAVAFDTEYDDDIKRTLFRYSVDAGGPEVYVIEAGDHDPTTLPQHPLHLVGQNYCTSLDLPFARQLGLPIDRMDDTMLMHAVLYPGWDHDLNYLGSLYGPINRWKHLAQLNPILYAGADARVTRHVFLALRASLDRQDEPRHTYETFVRPLLPVIQKSRARGLKVNVEKAKELAARLDRELLDLSLRAALDAGYPLELGSNLQVANHLYRIEHVLGHHATRAKGRKWPA